MNKIINIYWTRHALSCSNVASAYSVQKTGNDKYKDFKKNLYKSLSLYRKDSKLTPFSKLHTKKISNKINFTIDKIISSNLIRAIETANIFSKNVKKCNDRNIYISPYIQELGSISNGINARTIVELEKYLSENNLLNTFFLNDTKIYKEKPNINKFYMIIKSLTKNIDKKVCNILVISHGGLLSRDVLKKKIRNLEIWKQTIEFANNTIITNKAVLNFKGIGNERNKDYYSKPINFGLNNKEFNYAIKRCGFI